VVLPFAFAVAGLLALCAGTAWLVLHPALLTTYHYNQDIIALTHLFVLGWIASIVMGATYQLVPVALETRLHSEPLARWQFVLHCVGITGMVWMFHVWNLKQVGHFGSVLAIGVALFVYNIGQTLRRVEKWSVTATAITGAITWLALAVLAGLSIAAGKSLNGLESATESASVVSPLLSALRSVATFIARFDPIALMHAHAHLGAVGCFTILIVGVSYKVIPMFTLSEVQSQFRAGASILLCNLGLAASFITILLRSRWKPVAALLGVLALTMYGWELTAILRKRKRRALDWGIKYFLTAIIALVPVTSLALVLSWPGLPLNSFTGQLENLYGFLALVGFISFAIVGMLYKILPFLIWFKCYSRQVGRAQVPSLAELYSSRWQAVGYWAYVLGLATTAVGILCASEPLVRTGCVLLAAALITLLINVALMLSHKFHPKTRPFPSQNRPAAKFA
jgi:hypothetical protein